MPAPIVVFDSGVGGLSVLAHIRDQLPQSPLVYVCDNAALPYGTKPNDWLNDRIIAVCEAAVQRVDARALVVACNTASTLALDALRERLQIPVIGTVPAIKPAASATATGEIALLATSATVHRPYLDRLIAEFASHCTVLRIPADGLVTQAERLLSGAPVDSAEIEAALAPLWAHPRVDTVVLGCTHFPLLQNMFDAIAQQRAPRRAIQWLDSGAAIARRVKSVLGEREPTDTNALVSAMSLATAPDVPGVSQAMAWAGMPAVTALMVDTPMITLE